MRHKKGKKGFTLIELLVVIAIIAMLLAILMPALGKAKKIAKNVICRTNIRSLGLGYSLFLTETNKSLNYSGDLWLNQMANQLSEIDKIRYCPETKLNTNPPPTGPGEWAQGIGTSKTTWVWTFGTRPPEYGSYAFNFWLYKMPKRPVGSSEDPDKKYYWKTPSPGSSVPVPLFADCQWVDVKSRDDDFCFVSHDLKDAHNDYVDRIPGLLMNRHEKTINIGFVDGSVSGVRLEMLWSLKWGKGFKTLGAQTRRNEQGELTDEPIYRDED